MDGNLYQYLPIVADREIRLLKLEPAGSFSDPLIASLFVRRLQDSPEAPLPTYDGVSYCWGTIQEERWLNCDNQRLQITANVDEILRHLRKTFQPRNLWVDALCINQVDDKEKAKQVGSMGRIYKRANKVHVWLGPASTENSIESVFSVFREKALASEDFLKSTGSTFGRVPKALEIPLASFLSRPWFSRRWVLQEVALAHSVTVHCGHHRISWNWVRDGIAMLHMGYARGRNAYIDASFPISAVHALESAVLLQNQPGTTTILQLLWNHHASKCADDRDHLFALYGMVTTDARKTDVDPYGCCPVDYSKHFATTYTTLATAAIKAGYGLDVMNHVIGFGNIAQQNPDWPSWVPSWNKSRKSRGFMSLASSRDPNRRPSMTVIDGQTQPRLRLKGKLHRITETQQGEVTHGAVTFFKTVLQSVHRSDHRVMYGKVMASVLARSIEISRRFYDRTDFDFDGVFTTNDTLRNRIVSSRHTYNNKMDHVLLALEQEFGITLPIQTEENISNDKNFHQEVDRVLQGHELFHYELEGSIAPGVAFAVVRSGDYVLRLVDLSSTDPSNFALVVRPYFLSPKDTHPMPGMFRLVGACVDSHPWIEEFRYLSVRQDQRTVSGGLLDHEYVDLV